MKRLIIVLLIALFIGGIMFAGGAPEATTDEKVTITHWTWLDMDPVAREYEALNPNVKIEVVRLGPWDLHDKLLVSLASGQGLPDVATLVVRRFPNYSTTGKLYDLTPYVKDEVDNYDPGVLDAVSYQGKVFGLPNDISPMIFYYRTDIFNEVGIDVEDIRTFEDYREAGKKLKEAGYYLMPMFYPASNWGTNALNLFLHSNRGNFFTADGKVKTDNPELLEVLKYFYDLVFVDKTMDTIKYFTNEFWGSFNADKYATWIVNAPEAANMKQNLPDLAGKWSVARVPQWKDADDNYIGVWGGSILTIPAQAENKEAALDWIKWLNASVDGQIAQSKAWNAIPSYLPALDAPHYQDDDPYFGIRFLDFIEPMEIPPYYYYDWAQTEVIVGNQMDLMFGGEQGYMETYEGIIRDLKNQLNR
jgi:ABC-type glycerol-3-phosphate transport system substrate-binding protein